VATQLVTASDRRSEVKAIAQTTYGPPDALQCLEIPKPRPTMRRDHRRERISLDLRVQRALNPNGIYVVLGGIRWQEWPTHSTTCAPATPVARS